MQAALLSSSLAGLIIVWLPFQPAFGQQEPVIEYSSLLSNVRVSPTDHVLDLKSGSPLFAAHLPSDATVAAVLTKVGNPTRLFTQTYRARAISAPFSQLNPTGTKQYAFEEAGDYQLLFYANQKTMTQLKFSISMGDSKDPAKPEPLAFTSGPWEQWAYLWFPKDKRGEGQPEVRIWRNGATANEKQDAVQYNVEIKKDGEIVASGGTADVTEPARTLLKFPLVHRANQDGSPFLAKELLVSEGHYHVFVKKAGQVDAVYQISVDSGKLVFPKRQTQGYQPHVDYIYPRIPDSSSSKDSAGDTLWMGRLSEADALKAAGQKKPAIEYSSLLASLNVSPRSRRLEWDPQTPIAAAFLSETANVEAVLTKANDFAPLHRQAFRVAPLYYPFSQLFPEESPPVTLEQAGDYQIAFFVNGKPSTRLKFSVELLKNDDVFTPVRFAFLQKPWTQFAYLWLPLENADAGRPEIRLWRNLTTLDAMPEAVNYAVEIQKDGEAVAIGGTRPLESHKQLLLRFPLDQVYAPAGTPFLARDLFSQDGTYNVIVKKNDQLDAVFSFEVAEGKPVLPERQAMGFEPHEDYLLPRYPGANATKAGAGDTLWMNRLGDKEAAAIVNVHPAKTPGPSEEQLSKWRVATSVDPKRPTQLTFTEMEIPNNAKLSAGDGVIAFGTGSPLGVKYLVAGEKSARDIPEGATYSSKAFHVAGKKIVLVKEGQVVIHDTATHRSDSIPAEEISLDAIGDRGPLLAGDGYLVAAINRPENVSDQTIVKVIDVSGETPQVIAIKNSMYSPSDVSSVAIDAKTGTIAIASQSKNALFIAPIVPGARQEAIPLARIGGLGEQPIQIDGPRVLYADARSRLRMLDLTDRTNDIIQVETPSAAFAVGGGKLAVAKRVGKDDERFPYVVGPIAEKPQAAANQGTPIDGTDGFGKGTSAVIADDGTVFIAGTGGFKKGDFLQLWQDNNWTAIRDPKAKPVSAIDIVKGNFLIAFKSQIGNQKTVLAYATHGETVTLPSSKPLSAPVAVRQAPKPVAVPRRPVQRPTPISASPPPPPKPKGSGWSFWVLVIAMIGLVGGGGFVVYQRKTEQ